MHCKPRRIFFEVSTKNPENMRNFQNECSETVRYFSVWIMVPKEGTKRALSVQKQVEPLPKQRFFGAGDLHVVRISSVRGD